MTGTYMTIPTVNKNGEWEITIEIFDDKDKFPYSNHLISGKVHSPVKDEAIILANEFIINSSKLFGIRDWPERLNISVYDILDSEDTRKRIKNIQEIRRL